jgi:DNA-binding response OmpR family regulator
MPSNQQMPFLVVEDEYLIAMDIEEMLQELGVSNVVVVPSCQAAETWLVTGTPGAAILDIYLKDGSCAATAQTLLDRGVPFIVSSGRARGSSEPVFDAGVWLPKPVQPGMLAGALSYIGFPTLAQEASPSLPAWD